MNSDQFESRRRWMLVDDTPEILEAVALLLEAVSDAEICRYHSSEEALRDFASDPGAYEIVVTDLDMPELNGLELCQAIHEIAPAQKVILATGSSEVTKDEIFASGFSAYLKKPFPMRELLEALEMSGVSLESAITEANLAVA
jgi:two-component system cell cycle sensor histidine kinase/response regulator CckA